MSWRRVWVACAGAMALAACVLAGSALAGPQRALADGGTGAAASPCAPTAEQRAAYAADGSWEARAAFQEGLANDQADEGLIQQALARQGATDGIVPLAVPSNWKSGMGTTGSARVLALRVSFPDRQFAEDDTLEALRALIGGEDAAPSSAASFPYENLSAYYARASYGKLSIGGRAVDYRAQHERSFYTNDVESLFVEALAALDGNLDFADFDGNGDGYIDAVYLHFAGNDEGWGSTWWSNERRYDGPEALFDGKRLCNIVMLHTPSADPAAAATMIHETGHVLGLPDYYSYAAQMGSSSARTGILTFDMMMNNCGDHNGFSKWMLGWLDSDDVVRVVANDQGIVVKRGSTEVERIPPPKDGTPVSLERELAAFTSDEQAEGGGIMVVSNEDEGLFSSYYLLQYDRCAGNQTVGYLDASSAWHDLPSGFRLYRVQAALTPDGSEFARTNASGRVNDQLIELVDPDMDADHTADPGSIPHARDGFHCMLFAGDAVTPTTYPSTNFNENAAIGFTGLAFEATASEADRGAVRLSFSSANRPDPSSFTLTPMLDRGVMNIDTVPLQASSAPLVAFPDDPEMRPALVVDGVPHPADLKVSGSAVEASFKVGANALKPDSTCELVFPAKLFLVARTEKGERYSPEIRVPLVPAHLAPVERWGSYAGTESLTGTSALSDVFACADGRKRFFQTDGDELRLCTVDPLDPTAVDVRAVEGASLPFAIGEVAPRLTAVPLAGSSVFLAAEQRASVAGFWVDVETGMLEAAGDLSFAWAPKFVRIGDTAALVRPWSRASLLVTGLYPQDDGTLGLRHGTLENVVSAINADSATVALCSLLGDEGDQPALQARLVPGDAVDRRLEELMPEPSADDPVSPGTLDGGLPAGTILEVPGYLELGDVQAADGSYYALAHTQFGAAGGEGPGGGATQENVLVRFDGAGVEQARVTFGSATGQGRPFSRLSVGARGSVAASCCDSDGEGPFAKHETAFFDADLRERPHLLTVSRADGAWIDGRWLAVGWNAELAPNAAGSPAADGVETGAGYLQVRYDLTAVIDDGPHGPGSGGETARDPSAQSQPEAHTLSATGDSAAATTAALAGLALAAGVGAIAAARVRGSFFPLATPRPEIRCSRAWRRRRACCGRRRSGRAHSGCGARRPCRRRLPA